MKWKVSDSCLKEYLEEEKGFTFKIPKEDNFLRNVQLSLLLIAYIVKVYLN